MHFEHFELRNTDIALPNWSVSEMVLFSTTGLSEPNPCTNDVADSSTCVWTAQSTTLTFIFEGSSQTENEPFPHFFCFVVQQTLKSNEKHMLISCGPLTKSPQDFVQVYVSVVVKAFLESCE